MKTGLRLMSAVDVGLAEPQVSGLIRPIGD
jgi:hypothetical protein